MNQYKFQAESLDKEAEDLDEKIRLHVEQKKNGPDEKDQIEGGLGIMRW